MASTSNLRPNDNQSVQRLIQSITLNIQKIAQNVSQIENMNMQIGTNRDSETLRERLLQTENFTNQLAKDTNRQLKELNSYVRSATGSGTNVSQSSEERQIKIQKERLTNDLVKTLNKFQEVQKSAMQKQRDSNERARANMAFNEHLNEDSYKLQTLNNSGNNLDFDSSNPFSDQHTVPSNRPQNDQTQITMENDINLTQLREREAALRKLENDIVDVNMIFKDLAVMVHDQGDMIDSIESNVEQVQIRVNEANTHLQSAKNSQVKARKRKFILMSILAIIVVVILLVIILSTR